MMATHNKTLFDAAVERAVGLLKAGKVVGLPTETVYGLAANGLDAGAVARVFEVKGRPAHNPVILHVAGVEMARQFVKEWPAVADRLAKAFWPGPLTFVLPRAESVPDVVTAGGETVAIRWPSHPIMQAVIRGCGFPLAAPSANRSNEVSPTNASHVRQSLGESLELIVDGGQSQVGIESTVLDLTSDRLRVLRPGLIHSESIIAALGPGGELEEGAEGAGGAVLRSPGNLRRHYSPKAKVLVLSWQDDNDLRRQLEPAVSGEEKVYVIAHSTVPSDEGFEGISVIPHDAEAYARALYAELHRCDEQAVEVLVIEAVPDGVEWRAIADRLHRAAG